MFFQRKNSKKVKDTDGSPKKESSRGKSDLLDRAKGGLGAIAGSFQSMKNGAEERAEKLQEDMKSGIETIVHKGSGFLEKAKDIGGQSESSHSRELEQGSEEQGKKDMDSFHSVLHKVKDEVKDEARSLAHAFHLGHHHHESQEKKPEADEQAKEAETAQNVDESASTNKTEDSSVVEVEQAAEEISSVQVQTDTAAQTETPNEAPAETSAQAENPEAAERKVEKDDPTKRIGFLGFFARLFERFCSPGDKKKD